MAAGFWGKLWNGIKKGAKKVAEVGKKVVSKVVDVGSKVANVAAQNKDLIAMGVDMFKPGMGQKVAAGISGAAIGLNLANNIINR